MRTPHSALCAQIPVQRQMEGPVVLSPGDYVTGLGFCFTFSLPANCPLTSLRAESKRRGICEVGSPYGW